MTGPLQPPCLKPACTHRPAAVCLSSALFSSRLGRREAKGSLARDGTAPLESNGPHHPHTAIQDILNSRRRKASATSVCARGHSAPRDRGRWRQWRDGGPVYSQALPASAAAHAVETRNPNSRRPATGRRRESHWRRGLRPRTDRPHGTLSATSDDIMHAVDAGRRWTGTQGGGREASNPKRLGTGGDADGWGREMQSIQGGPD
jgi:hypothetical protein